MQLSNQLPTTDGSLYEGDKLHSFLLILMLEYLWEEDQSYIWKY